MSQPLFSISVLPLFFFIIVIKSKGSNTTTSFSNHCPSYNCSGVLVNYPFWRLDTSTTNHHCGYTGFGLNCSSAGNPILNLSGESYYVREINYTSHTLTLADADVVDQSCPRAQHNLTLEKPIPLRYSTLDLNISFYFHCSTGDSYGYSTLPNSVSCFDSSGSGNVSYVYVDRAEPDDFDWFNLCEKKVVVTVIETEIGRNRLTSGFAEAMHSGFVLDWRTEAECGVCEASEGRCGYDHVRQSFVCYCSDGAVRANHCRAPLEYRR